MKNINCNWFDFYKKEDFDECFVSFIDFLSIISKNYDNYTNEEILNIAEKYVEFWDKIILLCKHFLWDNLIIVDNEKDIVAFLISCGIFTNGKLFYLLHKKMQSRKNKNIIQKKYFNQPYIGLFKELKIFFETRSLREAQYELDS